MTTATTERPALTERLGLASPSSGPLCHLEALYRKGYLRRTNKGRYRGYALAVEPGCCACCGQPVPTEPRP